MAHPSFVLFAFAAMVVSRKPDAFLAAQFWAEDGVVWYRQAYEMGWMSLLHPQNGYFQTVSKIAGNLGQFVDLARAPLLFSLIALAFKLLPVVLLYSSRGKGLVPSASGRLLVGFLYVAHPYSWEVFINVTNIHWHLAIAALLVICFASWDGPSQKISDCAIVLLCGLSGTFALFLAPISAWHWFRTRSRRSLVLATVLFLAASIQLAALLMTGAATRSSAPLDASWGDLYRIVGGQITAASILGDGWRPLFVDSLWQESVLIPFALSAVLVTFMGAERSSWGTAPCGIWSSCRPWSSLRRSCSRRSRTRTDNGRFSPARAPGGITPSFQSWGSMHPWPGSAHGTEAPCCVVVPRGSSQPSWSSEFR